MNDPNTLPRLNDVLADCEVYLLRAADMAAPEQSGPPNRLRLWDYESTCNESPDGMVEVQTSLHVSFRVPAYSWGQDIARDAHDVLLAFVRSMLSKLEGMR